MNNRKILHVDMDAFFASVEMLDNPSLQDKPFVVGGEAGKRGVIATASYAARKFGVRSAMATAYAKKLCPDLVVVRPHMQKYRDCSQRIRDIFYEYTDIVEPLSLDEAWLDVSENKKGAVLATPLAKEIQAQIIQQTGLTCSVGVSYNKFLAKIASGLKKPSGIVVIPPDKAHAFLMDMSVRKIPGVGSSTEQKLKVMNIRLGADLIAVTESELKKKLGKIGTVLYQRIRGVDDRPVQVFRVRKSVSSEETFESDIQSDSDLEKALERVVEKTWDRCQKLGKKARGMVLKVKFGDFQQVSRNRTRDHAIVSKSTVYQVLLPLLLDTVRRSNKSVRLIGVGLTGFDQRQHVTGGTVGNLFDTL